MPKSPRTGLSSGYLLATYLLTLLPMGWFGVLKLCRPDCARTWDFLLYLLVAWLGNTALLLTPAWLCALAAGDPLSRPPNNEEEYLAAPPRVHRGWRWLAWSAAGTFTGLAWVVLALDIGIHHHFGKHFFNGLVINLLITPGGFSAMGLDFWSLSLIIIGLFLLLCTGISLALAFPATIFIRRHALYLAKRHPRLAPGAAIAAAAAFFLSLFSTGLAEFYQRESMMAAVTAYPVGPRVRMRTFLKALGYEPVPRRATAIRLRNPEKAIPDYPRVLIERNPDTPRPNILWICAESLRADLLTAHTMPATWQFGAEHATRYTRHFSGGNGTRPGIFSMFYGLYGTAWDAFLNTRRTTILFDWLQQDSYQILVQTAARFTYPEFDQTVFARLAPPLLVEEPDGNPCDRDRRITDRAIRFIQQRDPKRPFFAFLFYESTHAPYSFPPDQAPYQPVVEILAYPSLTSDDRLPLLNRQRNAARQVDHQCARLFELLQQQRLLDNTIVIFTGDHGEEFYEHGRLGHNSAYVNEQIHTPLLIHFPDTPPAVYDRLSHHCDLVPTLAPCLGVKNPPQDYSVGGDLRNPDYQRQEFVVCGWKSAVLVTAQGKYILPINDDALYIRPRLLGPDDEPDDRLDDFYNHNRDAIQRAHRLIWHCLKRPAK